MIFQGKYDRARALEKERMEGRKRAVDEDDLESKLEKNDVLAMILSALMVFLPAALIVLGILALVGYLFFFR